MERRCFLSIAGTGFAGLAGTTGLVALQEEAKPERTRYELEIEIYEAREDSWCHKKGDRFKYPAEIGKMCPWLLASMHDFLRLLQHGVTLPWKYENTPYEKVINQDGVTTEYVRCPDPTADLVAKITRKQIT